MSRRDERGLFNPRDYPNDQHDTTALALAQNRALMIDVLSRQGERDMALSSVATLETDILTHIAVHGVISHATVQELCKMAFDARSRATARRPFTVIGLYEDNLQNFAENIVALDAEEAEERMQRKLARDIQEIGETDELPDGWTDPLYVAAVIDTVTNEIVCS